MRFAKAYVEISNICNLSCSFCPGTKRAPKRMSYAEFKGVLESLSGYVEYLYFHLLGEPLCHPELERFLNLAGDLGYKVTIITNGTLIDKHAEALLSSSVYKIVFSLHSFEANSMTLELEKYLDSAFDFGKSVNGRFITVFRLWNQGGLESLNSQIISRLSEYFPKPWQENRTGMKIGEKAFLEFGDKFEWPSLSNTEETGEVFCYGLRDQIGILADGTVVPCCLDSNGDIALGNIFKESLDLILASPRAESIYNGFSNRRASEELCRKCSYAKRF